MAEDITTIYMNQIHQIPLLTQEEEYNLAERAAQGDENAKRKLVESNLRLVASIAHSYIGKFFDSLKNFLYNEARKKENYMNINGYEIIPDGHDYVKSGPKAQDLTGKKFGRWIVIGSPYRRADVKKARTYYPCYCSCGKNPGKAVFILRDSLLSGNSKSCGCWNIEYHRQVVSRLHSFPKKDRTGDHYNFLTAEKISDEKYLGEYKWYWRNELTGELELHLPSIVIKGQATGISKATSFLSRGALLVKQILISNDIKFIQEKTYTNLKDQGFLRYDFYLPDYNTLIEYDGKQHYDKNCTGRFANKYDIISKHDKMKNEYAFSHNINLIRIPYYFTDEITLKDLLPKTSRFLIKKE